MLLFDFIKSQLSVFEVISEYVQLKQAGNYYKGHCPFHTEKDASFTVSPDKQIFYCFGCQAGGDLIAFIAKAENMTQFEAVQHLIERYQITVPEEIQNQMSKSSVNSEQKSSYFNTCNAVAKWANSQLSTNNVAKKYLTNRDITDKDIKYFDVGYFPGGTRQITKLLKEMTNVGILAKDLIEAGILHQGQSVLYSPFEERIIFPIKDSIGRYCGFGGRIFRLQDQRAKYYNSKESTWFLKGKLLFGLDLAKKEMQKISKAYLVEGYTDCLAMAKHGYKNTVATLGTACTQEHLKALSRYVKTLYVMYDGDAAGQKAILRLTQLCWDVNLELKIIKLPHNQDPASFLENNGNLEDLISQSLDIFAFFIKTLSNNFHQSPLSEKIDLSNKIVELIIKLDNKIKQEILLQQASYSLQIPFEVLKDLAKKASKSTFNQITRNKETRLTTQNTENKASILEERIFSAIINSVNREKQLTIDKDLVPYFSKYIRSMLTQLKTCTKPTDSPNDCFKIFINKLNESDKKWVMSCSLKYEQSVSQDLFDQLIFHFCKKNWRQIVQDLKNKLRQAGNENDTKKQTELFSLFSKLKQGIKIRGLI